MLNGGNGAYKDCKYDVNTESSYNGCIWHFFFARVDFKCTLFIVQWEITYPNTLG